MISSVNAAVFFTRLGILVLLTSLFQQSVEACRGTTRTPGCSKSMVMAKAVPEVILSPVAAPATIGIPVQLFAICGPSGCLAPPSPVSAEAGVTLTPMGGGVPITGMVSTMDGTMPFPACSGAGTFTSFTVPLTIPIGTLGLFTVSGTTTVTFSDGTTVTASGDSLISFVEEAPGQPGVPRLDLRLISPSPASPFLFGGPGSQEGATYEVRNGDTEPVTLTLTATSNQIARMPSGTGELFSIASPNQNDEIPIVFNADRCSIPLPLDPASFSQPDLTAGITLNPGEVRTIRVDIRSYPGCGSGSCSETTLLAQGTFANGDPAEACAATAYYVSTERRNPCDPSRTWTFVGTAEGGEVSATINGCPVSIVTVAGQTAAEVAISFAAAVNGDSCVTSQGLGAAASGGAVIITGPGLDVTGTMINDSGLRHSTIPTLSEWGVVALALMLVTAAFWRLGRRFSV